MIGIEDILRSPLLPNADTMFQAIKEGKPEDGMLLEFGVYKGTTIKWIANVYPNCVIHGFDSWIGLPSEWSRGEGQRPFPAGHFSCGGKLPSVPKNVVLHAGWFSDTLPPFLKDNPGKDIRFINMDCDLYVSTKQVLTLCNDRIKPGTAIYFDEICDWGGGAARYPGWPDHEIKALQQWCNEFDRDARALSRNGAYGASVIITR